MNKNLSTVIFFFLVYAFAYTQVGVGTIAPNASLDIVSSSAIAPTNKDGILIPRINNFPTTNPTVSQDGMLVFITGNGTPAKGFYYWDQPTLSWVSVGGNSGVKKINDLLDGKSDTNGSSVFLGVQSGSNDDGTNNQNVGVGFQSLKNSTSGYSNTAIGYQSLFTNSTGNGNTANGFLSLHSNTGGLYNSAYGVNSLFSNTTGQQNVAIGNSALYFNSTGIENVSVGVNSLRNNTVGYSNVANGFQSQFTNTTGYQNTSVGYQSLYSNIGGFLNSSIGYQSMYSNTTGSYNTANGILALYNNISGKYNTAIGGAALYKNTTGGYNTSIGESSLMSNTTGDFNTVNGGHALFNNGIGSNNTSVGYKALFTNAVGNNNTALGYTAFLNGSNFSNSTAIGSNAQITASNQIRIGSNAVTSIGGFANWTNVSDGRFKKDIKENVKGLEFILKLRPVTYHLDLNKIDNYLKIPDSLRFGKDNVLLKYRQQKEQEVQSGFIAQEVEKAAKDLGYDFSGVDKPKNSNDYYGLRYAEFVVPLVKSVQEQQEMIKGLKEENKLLKEELKIIKKLIKNKR